MKNNCFSKVPLLAISLLVISSGQALSLSSNNKDLSHGDGLGKAELASAQDNISLGFAISVAAKALDTVVVKSQTVARSIPVNVPSEYRDIVLPKLQQAVQSLARAESSAQKGDNTQVARALSIAVTFLGEARADAVADTGTVQAITQVIVKANEALAIATGKSST
ncbi:hypothetical protein [uncultured Nostoc sp.]|uniref:hypothetical protein n=1 Tax=uncultured Nostoc sp. TaxID=340711 RepID=UPI0035CAD9CA